MKSDWPLTRRAFLGRATLVGGSAFLAACQRPTAAPSSPAAPPQASPGTDRWEQLVGLARQEGEVVVYAGAAFERNFPGVRVQTVAGQVGQLLPRLMAERTAGRYMADVSLSLAGGPAFVSMKDAGVFAPLEPVLVLAEVLDKSAWLDNRLWWTDESEPKTTLRFQGSVQAVVSYNTRLIDPTQFTSYWDFLDPRFRGQIVATDVRNPGPGSLQSVFLYTNPQLGPAWLDRLFGDMAPVLSNDQRQMIDWVATGQYPIGIMLNSRDVGNAIDTGLAIAIFPSERLKEGAPTGSGAGVVSLFDRAPHPNASAVFINWLLTREGQGLWQRSLKVNSLRIDIPKDGIFEFDAPKPGVKYEDMGLERYGRISQDDIRDFITASIQRSGR
ncbi:MAG: ABC-type Fe3+ transport system periplasmic component [Chloroflexi bacterium]|nr:ABC-type Fe3+ transport system periplasmic component [Chloroflexota bacterium]